MANTGKNFEKKFTNSCKAKDFMIIRLRDNTYFRRLPSGAIVTNSSKTPADFIVFTDCEAWLVECKYSSGKAFPYKRLAPHQEAALVKASSLSSRGLLALGFEKRCFLVPIEHLIAYRESNERKSFPIAECERLVEEELAYECEPMKGSVFNIPCAF